MELEEIEDNLIKAIEMLEAKDSHLLEHDLSEQCIAHKLAEKLQLLFEDNYHVDCEYNGNVDGEGGRKRIDILTTELEELNRLNQSDDRSLELQSRAVFPDIIIHKRGKNYPPNLCIIEIKKSTNTRGHDFDRLKLKAYTTGYYDNDLRYQVGFFLIIGTGEDTGANVIEKYVYGKELLEEE